MEMKSILGNHLSGYLFSMFIIQLSVLSPIPFSLSPLVAQKTQTGDEAVNRTTGPFTFEINEDIRPSQETVAGERNEPDRSIVVMMHPTGVKEEFVENEIILKPRDEEELQEFLTKYNGRVLNDGTVPPPPDIPYDRLRQPFKPSGYYTIRIDTAAMDLTDFTENMSRLDFRGTYTFSSFSAVKLIALVAREKLAGKIIQNNGLVLCPSKECVINHSEEHATVTSVPNTSLINNGYTDGFEFDWINDVELQVSKAWQYIDLLGLSSAKVSLAVVDRGFIVNKDFRGFPSIWGYDFVDNDYHQDVQSNEEYYHGTRAFSTAGALINNQFGSVGTGGQVVVPLFFRSKLNSHTANAIYNAAVNWGADVITISLSSYVSFDDVLKDALSEADKKKVIVVAAAANDETDLNTTECYTCEGPKVICVGAIDPVTKLAIRKPTYSWGSNYGSNVDIWAPGEHIDTTPTPTTGTNLSSFNGTSAATPYVAGIVCLMKAIDPSLDHDQVLSILQSTANTSTDARVTTGFIDAYEAFKKTASNAGIYVQGDSYETNDSFSVAASISDGKDYTATITPADNDYFKFLLNDYTAFIVSAKYRDAGNDNDIIMELFNSLEQSLKRTTATSVTLGVNDIRQAVNSITSPDGYCKISGQNGNTMNCYTLRITPGSPLIMIPDVYDDGVHPDKSIGEPQNNTFANRAIIKKTIQPTFGLVKAADIDDLNFHVKGDIDFFEVTLPPDPDPKTGVSECYGISGRTEKSLVSQGCFVIDVSYKFPGFSWPFEIKLYDASGVEFKNITYKSDYILKLECPHKYFTDGKIRFSVKAKDGRRNYYYITFYYNHWTATPQNPSWADLLTDPPLFNGPQPPVLDRSSWVSDRFRYPSNLVIRDRMRSGVQTLENSVEYQSFHWEKGGDLDLDLRTEGQYLEMTLLDMNKEILASTSTGSPERIRGEREAAGNGHMHISNLAPGDYIMAFGPGDFNTVYSIEFNTPTSISGQATDFIEDFESNTHVNDWNREKGWSVSQEAGNNALHSADRHNWTRLMKGQDWSDYTFKSRIKMIKSGLNINVRVSDKGRYYLGFGENGLTLRKEMPWGESFELAESETAVTLNAWHDVSIRTEGAQLQVYVDNNLAIDFEDSLPLTKGSIAFEALDGSDVYIDDVIVEPLR